MIRHTITMGIRPPALEAWPLFICWGRKPTKCILLLLLEGKPGQCYRPIPPFLYTKCCCVHSSPPLDKETHLPYFQLYYACADVCDPVPLLRRAPAGLYTMTCPIKQLRNPPLDNVSAQNEEAKCAATVA